jgi:hypothetical protein
MITMIASLKNLFLFLVLIDLEIPIDLFWLLLFSWYLCSLKLKYILIESYFLTLLCYLVSIILIILTFFLLRLVVRRLVLFLKNILKSKKLFNILRRTNICINNDILLRTKMIKYVINFRVNTLNRFTYVCLLEIILVVKVSVDWKSVRR